MNWDIQSLKKHVRTKDNKNEAQLTAAGMNWLKACAQNGISYEVEWLGVPIIQCAADIVLIQELIFKLKPDAIIETGVAHGGSLVLYASLLNLLGAKKVIGVDIEIRKHNREVLEQHPLYKWIELIEGSSIAPQTFERVKQSLAGCSKVLVCLDSDHHREHVLNELRLYSQLIPKGSYIVVYDTVCSLLVNGQGCDESYANNGPLEAIDDFLKENDCFEIDKTFNRLYTSASPDGYLRRIK